MRPFTAVTLLILLACNILPEKVRFSHPEVRALLKARTAVDTAALGFTPLTSAKDLRLERSSGAYDAMLHVYGETSRTVSYRKADGGWRWTGEQEIHTGPKTLEHPDGTMNERITITYEIEPVSGAPLNQIDISYWGEDPRLSGTRALKLSDVRPILEEWRRTKPRSNSALQPTATAAPAS